MSKQDRQGVRTPADVERKYNLGQLAAARGESQKQELALSQLTQTVNQYMASNNGNIENLNKDISNLNDGIDKMNEDVNGSLEEMNGTIDDLNKEIEELNKKIEELPDNPGGGESGTSPTIDVTDIDGGHRVTITDAEGTESFDVMDGKDGYTPIKGVDYFDGKDGDKGDKGDPFTYEDFTPEQLEALNPKPTIYSATKNVQITVAGIDTDTDGAEVTVPPGTYIITASAVFQTGTSNGARNNQIRLLADTSVLARERIYAGAYNYAELRTSAIHVATASNVLSVKKSSSITENAASQTKIIAVRIA